MWGDGMKVSVELCDDNNVISGDGCNNTCTIEPGYYCKQASSTSPSVWYTICGDGKRAGKTAAIWNS